MENKKKEKDFFGTYEGQINDLSALSFLENSFKTFSKEVIMNRALPDVRDGLKPVHRRILYVMGDNGYVATSRFVKQTKITGLVMAAYHPHGDSSINGATVRLSQNWVQLFPLIDTTGNNGSIDDDPAAAARYLEVRLSSVASKYLLSDLDKKVVPFMPTFDNDTIEPEVLPTKLPLLMLNGSFGIAVGYASNFFPNNPIELFDALIYLNKNENATDKKLISFLKGPDFPTGGFAVGSDGINESYSTGRGKILVRSKLKIEKNIVTITEIPYNVFKSDLIKSIKNAFIVHGLKEALKDLIDESSGENIKIVMTLAKSVDPDAVVNFLYKNSSLQSSFNSNFNAISHNLPVLFSLPKYLREYLEFFQSLDYNLFKFELDAVYKRWHLVKGVLIVAPQLDFLISLIRNSKNKKAAIEALMDEFGITELQSTYIVNLNIYRFTKEDFLVFEKENDALIAKEAYYTELIENETSFLNYVDKELKNIKKAFKDYPRKTVIIDKDTIPKVVARDIAKVNKEKFFVVFTYNSVYKMSPASYTANVDKLEKQGEIIKIIESDSTQLVLAFTSQGFVIQRLVDELDTLAINQTPTDFYRLVPDFKSYDEIIGGACMEHDKTNLKLACATNKGRAKTVLVENLLSSINTKRYLNVIKPYIKFKDKFDKVFFFDIDSPEAIDSIEVRVGKHSLKRRKTSFVKDWSLQKGTGSGFTLVSGLKDDDYVDLERLN